jgi:type IV fimbrial biogenesis protein FimT
MRLKPVESLGFTLIELMVTIAIAVILLSIAIPSFTNIVSRSRLTAYTNELVTALNLARSEAIKRGQHVVVRKTGTNWENGWQVFVDLNRTATANENVLDASTDILLREFPALSSNYMLRGNNNFINYIRYQPDGRSNQMGSFLLCNAGSIANAKLMIINAVGRLRMASDIDSDGIPEKEDGNEITSCTTGF